MLFLTKDRPFCSIRVKPQVMRILLDNGFAHHTSTFNLQSFPDHHGSSWSADAAFHHLACSVIDIRQNGTIGT